MEMIEKDAFSKEITHHSYKRKRRKSAFWAGYLPFHISELPLDQRIQYVGKNKDYSITDDNYLVFEYKKSVVLIIGLIISVFFSICFYYIEFNSQIEKNLYLGFIILTFLFSVLYFFIIPQKVLILDRLAIKISFPSFLLGPAYTLDFRKVRLVHAGGASGSPSPDRLNIRRPDMLGSLCTLHLGGSYFQELSFLVWYMDKNRPLPPGTAFDEYRKKDYQRRKKEGFPPPIFRSFIQTPEYKNKWQKVRDKYWRDVIGTDEKGNQVHQLWQSAENIALHGEWEEVVPQ